MRSLPRGTGLLEALGIAAVAVIVGMTLLPADVHPLPSLCSEAPYVTAALFLAGLVALLFGVQRAMIGAFLGSALIAAVLRATTSTLSPVPAVPLQPHAEGSLEFAQLAADNLHLGDGEDSVDEVRRVSADVLSVHGLTPQYAAWLGDSLRALYPHQYLFVDIGLQGIGLFSREPFGSVDSVVIAGITHVEACVSGHGDDADIRLIGVQTLPPVNPVAFQTLRVQLERVAEIVGGYCDPALVFGDFNAVPWSSELNDFLAAGELLDSRRAFQSTFVRGAPQLFEVPVEHIFYGPRLRCLNFETLRVGDEYLGNVAVFTERATDPTLAAR